MSHFKVMLEHDEEEELWIAYVPALNYLATQGDTRQQALDMAKEAILGYIEAARKEGFPVTPDDPAADAGELEDIEVFV